MKKCHVSLCALAVLVACLPAATVNAQADVALCQLHLVTKWGTVGSITAYSVGTTSVNVGSTNLNWIQNGVNHPVIGQTMYRIFDGKIEMIGQSWLKHSFCALQINSACDNGCPGQGGCLSFLAPGCQDPYSAVRNGSQSLLGPKYQVNANAGTFIWPHPTPGAGTITGRLQVHNSDLGDGGSVYLVEGQYVALDDANAGNQDNNASYRLVNISSAPSFNISFVAGQGTEFQREAIRAWADHGNGVGTPDPDVKIVKATDSDGGLFWVGYKASDNGDGTWHYEYAIQNMNSHQSGASFSVPVGAGVTVTNIDFHDVEYHSGDGTGGVNFNGDDWSATVGPGSVTWQTQIETQNPSANALRWGTMYNYRFDADSGPELVTATLGLYRGSPPDALSASISAPQAVLVVCPWDCEPVPEGTVGITDFLALLGQWNSPGSCDFDGGGVGITDFLDLLANWGPCP